ncbi:protein of unknown function (DUF697) [Pseudoduganella flava]|uniref:DUF697 domain-containing protein n=1 Tax=Pseudoduganella flava TaxID=871742 RepID=A0A562PNS0_9BURK|nr:hypothetical protein [Pseudoduganella flava]TWI45973.1 protein of unknown function (DUF697) [Pseudoduganella flava]
MDSGWELLPSSERDIADVRERCRRLVRKRATWAAGVAAVPLPGIDIVSDLKMFTDLIDEVNTAFGLTAEQIERLQPKFRMIAYEAAVSVGGMLVGKLVTRDLVIKLMAKSGKKMVAKQASKIVPLAGQVASAAIGFFAFRQIGYQHVEACAKVARELLAAKE